jgi:hypothetical protein
MFLKKVGTYNRNGAAEENNSSEKGNRSVFSGSVFDVCHPRSSRAVADFLCSDRREYRRHLDGGRERSV